MRPPRPHLQPPGQPVVVQFDHRPVRQLAHDLVQVCADTVVAPARVTMARALSMTSMSRSVARKLTCSASASISTLPRIGMVLRRSTTDCARLMARRRALRSMLSFMRVTAPEADPPRSRSGCAERHVSDLDRKGKRSRWPLNRASIRIRRYWQVSRAPRIALDEPDSDNRPWSAPSTATPAEVSRPASSLGQRPVPQPDHIGAAGGGFAPRRAAGGLGSEGEIDPHLLRFARLAKHDGQKRLARQAEDHEIPHHARPVAERDRRGIGDRAQRPAAGGRFLRRDASAGQRRGEGKEQRGRQAGHGVSPRLLSAATTCRPAIASAINTPTRIASAILIVEYGRSPSTEPVRPLTTKRNGRPRYL